MKMEVTSQRREMLLFLTTNTAAVTSPANHAAVYTLSVKKSGRHLEFLIYDIMRGKISAAIFEF